MADLIRTYECATSGAMRPSANLPVRLYTTGSDHKRVIRATGGEDARIIGIAKNGALTAGRAIAVLEQGEFMGAVATTVAAGALLEAGNGANFRAAGVTAGTRFCAQVLKARTDTGRAWLKVVPGGVV